MACMHSPPPWHLGLRTRVSPAPRQDELVARFADARGRAALFSPSGALTPGEANVLDGSQLRAEIADGRTPLLVDVYATWCV